MRRAVAVAALLASAASAASAGVVGVERIAAGLGLVTNIVAAPGDASRLFITTKGGTIWLYNLATQTVQQEPFLHIDGLDVEEEGGLLGLAFHPDYAVNRQFYVSVTVDNGGLPVDDAVSPLSTQIRQYAAWDSPNVAGPDYYELIQWPRPSVWHTAGWIGFGPRDGYLYISSGDGGPPYDIGPGHTPGIGNAQDLTGNYMGKLLRIDVDRDDFPDDDGRNYGIPPDNPLLLQDALPEIFAFGLRNPWRASFDRASGDLWIGDVGEAWREEVDLIPAGTGGQNFGWNQREGSIASPVGGPLPGAVDPVYDYRRRGEGGDPALQGNSVIGGYVYRGVDPDLYGKYLFGDFVTGQAWTFDPADPYGTVQNITAQVNSTPDALRWLTTFGADALGNLYFGTVNGNLFRILTNRVTGDLNGDGHVDRLDLELWTDHYGDRGETGEIPGDVDGDGDVDGHGLLLWQRYVGSVQYPPPSTEPDGLPAPEPAAGLMLAAALLGHTAIMRRTRRAPR